MPIRIIPASAPMTIDQVVLGIYSLPGIGKTTLGFTAEAPLLLDFDKGAHRARNRKDTVSITNWDEIASLTEDDLKPYKTIIVDTVGRALDVLSADIIKNNPKHGNGGALSLQGFGVLKSRFSSWLKTMRTYRKDVILLAHMDEKTEGEITKERLDVQGGSKAEIYKSVDAMGKIFIEGKTRRLDFSPREGSLGKNPAQFEVLDVPDCAQGPLFLAEIIRSIKQSINQLSAEQLAQQKAAEEWADRIEKLPNLDAFNETMVVMKNEPKGIKKLLMDAATNRGLAFNTKTKKFEEGSVAA